MSAGSILPARSICLHARPHFVVGEAGDGVAERGLVVGQNGQRRASRRCRRTWRSVREFSASARRRVVASAVPLTGWQRHASPQAVPERVECQQRAASSARQRVARRARRRARGSARRASRGRRTRSSRGRRASGNAAAASATRRGMSPVECLPGESMYGKTMSSVAPASTQFRTPAAMDGSASSMCA